MELTMNPAKIVAMVVGGLAVAAVAFFVFLFGIKFLWAWTVPELFPGAVAQGLVAGEIGWSTAAKLALLVALLSGVGHGSGHKSS
jgi:hypothetical protein